MSLLECLQEVKYPRRLQGQRYNSVAMLLLIIMAILRNKHGYREIGRFCALNRDYLVDTFGFKNPLMSVSCRQILYPFKRHFTGGQKVMYP
jgi:hypothetical protein